MKQLKGILRDCIFLKLIVKEIIGQFMHLNFTMKII